MPWRTSNEASAVFLKYQSSAPSDKGQFVVGDAEGVSPELAPPSTYWRKDQGLLPKSPELRVIHAVGSS
jgi:hypothetical protein